nr:PAS domain S-box protein [Rubellimicrobium aerolatum]
MVDAMPAIVFVTDEDSRNVYVNARYEAFTGLPAEALLGDGWRRALHPADRDRLTLRSADPSAPDHAESEFRLRTASGGYRWVRCRASLLPGSAAPRWIGVLSDVANRDPADDAGRATSEAWYRALFEQAAVGVARVGLDGRLLETNARFCAILGYGPHELRATSFQAITHPEDLAADLGNVEALLEGRVASYSMEKRYLAKSGAVVWAQLTVGLVRDEDGRPEFFVSVVEDITERRRADDRLRATEARFRALIENAPEKMWIGRADGSVEYFNAAAREFSGPAATGSRDWAEGVHPEDRPLLLARRARARADGRPYQVELRLRRERDQSWRWHLSHSAPLRDADGAIFAWVGMATDVDDSRRDAEARRLAAARDAFLLKLTDRLRALGDPAETIATAAEALARELGVDRVCYGEVDEDAGTYRILGGFAPEMPTGAMDHSYALEQFGPLAGTLRGGTPFLSPDVQADPRLASAWGDGARRLRGLGSVVCVPLVKDGRLVAVLSVESGTPRLWTGTEARLVEDVAARTWSAVERARAKRRLRETEERYRLAARATNDVIWDMRLADRQVIWNESLGTLFGHEETVTPESWWLERVHPDDRGRVARQAREIIDGQDTNWTAEYRFRRADGGYADVLDRGFLLRDAQGRPVRMIGAMQDLTARHAAEARLRDSEDRLRLATEAARIGTWDHDPVARVLRWDARSKELFGLPPEAEMGSEREFLMAVHPGDRARVAAAARAALDPEGTGDYDIEYRAIGRLDGMERWIAAKGQVHFVDGQPVRFVGIARDITGRKAAEIALAESRERLGRLNAELERRVEERTGSLQETARALEAEMRRREEAQGRLVQAQKLEALGQVVGGVAHDFNNVLAAIQGAFAMLDRRIEDEKLRFLIVEGRKAGDRAAALVRQMLAFARRQPTEPQVLDLGRMLPGLGPMLRHAMGARIELAIDVEPGLWPVMADPHQLEVAVLNLAVNARDALAGVGMVRLRARNLPGGATGPGDFGAGDRVEIAMADTGCGMEEAVLARAFEPFFTTKEPGKGTGLGLAQVHGVVQASGGELRAESAVGAGTTVAMILPRSALRAEDADGPEAATAGLHGGATVLLVDDDAQVRPVTAALLREMGYEVVEAPNAAVAVAMAQLHAVDLLLTDVVMPGTDGPALARSLRAERPGLPVLFFTGYAAGHDLRGEAVLAKPFTAEELGRQVLEALGRLPVRGRG